LASQSDFSVLGVTGWAGETIALCATLQPHVLVLGNLTAWPQDSAPIATIHLASPTTRVLALAPHGRDRCTYLNPFSEDGPTRGTTHAACLPKVVADGALAALDGDADPATLFAAVRTVARGDRWGAIAAPVVNGNGHALSPQELKVARLVGRGASNKEIAAALTISDLTVKKHLGSIFQKLELHDRLQLGLRVARNPTAFEGD
jgi:DNA-binding CsgD family transcriptional regulator